MKNECEHKFHFVRISPLPLWSGDYLEPLARRWAYFVCEDCGIVRKIRIKEE